MAPKTSSKLGHRVRKSSVVDWLVAVAAVEQHRVTPEIFYCSRPSLAERWSENILDRLLGRPHLNMGRGAAAGSYPNFPDN